MEGESSPMTVYVDADACPVVDIVVNISQQNKLPCVLICDVNHVIYSDYAEVRTVDAGRDSADFALINACKRGDIVVTQDYGLAALALGKGAYAIHQNGHRYTNDNIDGLLAERHMKKKMRNASGRNHIKGPKPRNEGNNLSFAASFKKLIDTAKKKKYFRN